MGLFGKGKKTSTPASGGMDMPPPPPKPAEADSGLPSFGEAKPDSLQLPEIPDLEASPDDAPSIPQFSDLTKATPLASQPPAPMPSQPQPLPSTRPETHIPNQDRMMEHPAAPKAEPVTEPTMPSFDAIEEKPRFKFQDDPAFNDKPSFLQDKPEHKADPEVKPMPSFLRKGPEEHHGEVYKHTPATPDVTPVSHATITPEGDVYVKGDTYRDIIEGLEDVLVNHKQKIAKFEKSTLVAREDHAYEKLNMIIEDLQRSLILTEGTLFE